MVNIDKKIKLEIDCKSSAGARRLAEKFIKDHNYPLDEVSGFVYIVGPTVSDLIIVKPLQKLLKKPKAKLRACTDKEWNDYFWTRLCGEVERRG